jgi:hypothetical protein
LVIYIITTLLIVAFYIAGFTLSQSLFNAAPNFNPLVVGAVDRAAAGYIVHAPAEPGAPLGR